MEDSEYFHYCEDCSVSDYSDIGKRICNIKLRLSDYNAEGYLLISEHAMLFKFN